MKHVVAFLIAQDFKKHVAVFEEYEINGRKFLALTTEDLVDMGVDKAFVRKQILTVVEEQRGLCLDSDSSVQCRCSVSLARCHALRLLTSVCIEHCTLEHTHIGSPYSS